MPRLALWILLVLALPLVVVAVTSPIEWSHETRGNWFFALAGAGFVIGFIVLWILARRSPKRQGVIDEKARHKDNDAMALWMASMMAELALLCAGSVIQLGLVIVGIGVAWTLVWIPRPMRHLRIRTTVVIGRDQSTVYSFVADERNAPRYVPEIDSVEKVTDGPIGKGTQFHSRQKLGDGETLEGIDEIIDYEPPNQIASRTVTALRPNIEVLTFESVPDGTRLRHQFDSEITYSNALMNQGLMKPLMVLDLRQRRIAVWKQLKRALESPVDT